MENNKEFIRFEKYHRNNKNVLIHILSFCIGLISFCFLFTFNVRIIILVIYIFFTYVYFNDLKLLIIIILILLIFSCIFVLLKLNYVQLTMLVIISYLIPEFSHIYFAENTYLYNRIYEDSNAYKVLITLFNHIINLVPFCIYILNNDRK